MKVQYFVKVRSRLRGPMGTFETEDVQPALVEAIAVGKRIFKPDASRWIEVPLDVYEEIKRYSHRRPDGVGCYMTPAQVPEELRNLVPESAPRRRTS
jgi:hypothetical protein